MARDLCLKCQRPIKACICAFICEVKNKMAVLILQHPSEVNQSKGTVALLQRSLNNCQVIVGEDFSDNIELNKILAQHQTLLLYPSEQAQNITLLLNNQCVNEIKLNQHKSPLLIILDGTWKKAYRMYMLSKNLQSLRQVCLPNYLANNGQYLIRKVAKKNALSSLEATCYALALFEGEVNCHPKKVSKDKQVINCGVYQPLLNKFAQFNQFQLSFRQ